MLVDAKRQRVIPCLDSYEDDEELFALLQASQTEVKPPAEILQEDLGASYSKSAPAVASEAPSGLKEQGSRQETHANSHTAHVGTIQDATHLQTGKSLLSISMRKMLLLSADCLI